MRVQRIRLDQHTLKFHFAEELLELRVLVSPVCRVSALRDLQAQRCRIMRTWAMDADPPPTVASIELHSVLPSEINW